MRLEEGKVIVEEGKVEEMTPPKPVKCHGYGLGEPPCEYVSRQGLPNHQLITEDLAMHQRVCSAMQRTVGKTRDWGTGF